MLILISEVINLQTTTNIPIDRGKISPDSIKILISYVHSFYVCLPNNPVVDLIFADLLLTLTIYLYPLLNFKPTSQQNYYYGIIQQT